VAAWPAVALVGSYELLMMIIRGTQAPAVTVSAQDGGSARDPLDEHATLVFAADPAGDRVPSIRAIRAALHVGQPRVQQLRDDLATAAVRQAEAPLLQQLAGTGIRGQRPGLEGLPKRASSRRYGAENGCPGVRRLSLITG
jgi:hypothetical protein